MVKLLIITLNTLISEDGTNSGHTHILAICQSYRGLKLLLSDTIFMAMINSMLTYHRFKKVNSAKCQYI